MLFMYDTYIIYKHKGRPLACLYIKFKNTAKI
jgi:hypothetical protein